MWRVVWKLWSTSRSRITSFPPAVLSPSILALITSVTRPCARKLNAKDYIGASEEFEKWCKVKGNTVEGLLHRRHAEKMLFLRQEE
jgi:hypothetical protein